MTGLLDIRLLDAPFDPNLAVDHLTDNTPDAGGIASFIGKVRAGAAVSDATSQSHDAAVEALELSHYPPLTLPGMQDLAANANERFSLMGLVILHRTGRLHPGDPIVCVSVAARHRRDAILAVDYCMDHLKSAAWFWKRELRGGEWRWIEPREADHADLSRW
ncbi:molybdenum cofactor biosynthesis protein MoaE [Erythrobacter sp. Alg231-14]|uniref:molybdenum cofactor biosynthesis protein MoaE n=1 Tax=Erythrobacter sp. Alg231-14 TaxID=1922225 RepID=UPI003FCD628C